MNCQPRKIYDGEGLGEDTAEANYVLEKMDAGAKSSSADP